MHLQTHIYSLGMLGLTSVKPNLSGTSVVLEAVLGGTHRTPDVQQRDQERDATNNYSLVHPASSGLPIEK